MINRFTPMFVLVLVMASVVRAATIPTNPEPYQAFAGDADIWDESTDCEGTVSPSGLATPLPRLLYNLNSREVYNPKITNPSSSTTWYSGQEAIVSWETGDIPHNITNEKSKVVLGRKGHGEDEHLDLQHPLASGFDIRQGSIKVQVPDVEPGGDYIIVLFGDSGNRSPSFSIQPKR